MKMTKLATLFLTATLSLASGAALAADSGAQTNNGQANAAADAGQVAPDARENVAPNNVDNNGVNTGSGGTMLHPDGSSMNNDGMTKDDRVRDLHHRSFHVQAVQYAFIFGSINLFV